MLYNFIKHEGNFSSTICYNRCSHLLKYWHFLLEHGVCKRIEKKRWLENIGCASLLHGKIVKAWEKRHATTIKAKRSPTRLRDMINLYSAGEETPTVDYRLLRERYVRGRRGSTSFLLPNETSTRFQFCRRRLRLKKNCNSSPWISAIYRAHLHSPRMHNTLYTLKIVALHIDYVIAICAKFQRCWFKLRLNKSAFALLNY